MTGTCNEDDALPPAAASSDADDSPPPPAARTGNDDGDGVVIDVDGIGDREIDGDADGGAPPSRQELPIEYQLYEVDLTNPDMDPLEYTFRRYVPIPKAYFWNTASEANGYNRNLPFRIKWWHRSIYYMGEALKKAEAGGEVIANFLGLNDGPFEYVTNNMTEEEMARSRANVEARMEEQAEMEMRKEGAGV